MVVWLFGCLVVWLFDCLVVWLFDLECFILPSLSNSIYDQRPVSYGGSGYGGGSFLSEVPARTGAWRVCPKPGGPAQAGSHIACTTSYSCSHTVINPNTYPLQPHQCNPASTHPQKHPPKLTPVTVLTDTQTSKGHRIHTLTHPYIQPPTHTDAHPPIHPSIHPSIHPPRTHSYAYTQTHSYTRTYPLINPPTSMWCWKGLNTLCGDVGLPLSR